MNKEIPRCISVANRIINRTNAYNMWLAEQGKPRVQLMGKRLQKILYLCQLFWYADHDESEMITEDFQAWPNGPVIPQIYDYFSVYQDGDMCPIRNAEIYSLSPEESELINKIVDNTIDISTESIIDYTRIPDGPWAMAQAYRNYEGAYNVISKNSIKQYIRREEAQRKLLDFIKNKAITYEEPGLTKKLIPPKNNDNK